MVYDVESWHAVPVGAFVGGFRLSSSTPLVIEITVFFSQNVRLIEEIRPYKSSASMYRFSKTV